MRSSRFFAHTIFANSWRLCQGHAVLPQHQACKDIANTGSSLEKSPNADAAIVFTDTAEASAASGYSTSAIQQPDYVLIPEKCMQFICNMNAYTTCTYYVEDIMKDRLSEANNFYKMSAVLSSISSAALAFPILMMTDLDLINVMIYFVTSGTLNYAGYQSHTKLYKKYVDMINKHVDYNTLTTFTQDGFNDKVRSNYPELKFNEVGLCFGHSMMWYIYKCENRNYLHEINNIENVIDRKIPLNGEQLRLLKNVSHAQETQRDWCRRYYPDKLLFTAKRETCRVLAESLVEEAVRNEGQLYCIIIQSTVNTSAHIIAMTALSAVSIHLFDSNTGEMSFNSRHAAKENLIRHLHKNYSNSTLKAGSGHLMTLSYEAIQRNDAGDVNGIVKKFT